MPKVVPTLEPLPRAIGPKDPIRVVQRGVQKIYEQAARVINGNLSYGDGTNSDNIAGNWADAITPVTPATEFAVTHNLGRIPVGYHVTQQNAPGTLYSSGTPWTKTVLYLKCTEASISVKLFIF